MPKDYEKHGESMKGLIRNVLGPYLAASRRKWQPMGVQGLAQRTQDWRVLISCLGRSGFTYSRPWGRSDIEHESLSPARLGV